MKEGIFLQNFLDPIAKVWGTSQPFYAGASLRKNNHRPDKGRKRSNKRVTKTGNFLLV